MDFLKKFKKLKKKGQSGSEIVAFFDVGNGSVGAALARITPDEPPTIFYTTRNPISLKKVPDFDQLTKSMLSTFLDTVMRVQTEGIPLISQQSKSGSITKVMCTYTSPWAATLAKRVVIKQENSTVVTEKQLTDILSKEEADFQKQLKEDKETASVFNTPKF
jgi:hypothetical protein